jgi:hypothetical protein
MATRTWPGPLRRSTPAAPTMRNGLMFSGRSSCVHRDLAVIDRSGRPCLGDTDPDPVKAVVPDRD